MQIRSSERERFYSFYAQPFEFCVHAWKQYSYKHFLSYRMELSRTLYRCSLICNISLNQIIDKGINTGESTQVNQVQNSSNLATASLPMENWLIIKGRRRLRDTASNIAMNKKLSRKKKTEQILQD